MQPYITRAISKVKKHGYHGMHSDGVTILYNSPSEIYGSKSNVHITLHVCV